jgi:hypothetical protein
MVQVVEQPVQQVVQQVVTQPVVQQQAVRVQAAPQQMMMQAVSQQMVQQVQVPPLASHASRQSLLAAMSCSNKIEGGRAGGREGEHVRLRFE